MIKSIPMSFLEVHKEMPTVPSYLEQIQDLSPVEQQGASAFLKSANEDSKPNVVQAVKNFRLLMSNDYECPPIGVRDSRWRKIVDDFDLF